MEVSNQCEPECSCTPGEYWVEVGNKNFGFVTRRTSGFSIEDHCSWNTSLVRHVSEVHVKYLRFAGCWWISVCSYMVLGE